MGCYCRPAEGGFERLCGDGEEREGGGRRGGDGEDREE